MWIISKITGVHPHDYQLKQEWTINPAGRKPWVYRAYKYVRAKLQKDKSEAAEEAAAQEFELMERDTFRQDRPRSVVASASTMDDKHSRRAQSPDHLRSD